MLLQASLPPLLEEFIWTDVNHDQYENSHESYHEEADEDNWPCRPAITVTGLGIRMFNIWIISVTNILLYIGNININTIIPGVYI